MSPESSDIIISSLGAVGGAGDYCTIWKVTSKVAFRVPSRQVLAEHGSVDRLIIPSPGIIAFFEICVCYWTRLGERTLWGNVAHIIVEKNDAWVLRRVCVDAWPARQRVWSLAAIAYAKMRTTIKA